MNINKVTNYETVGIDRYFKINQNNNIVDLRESFSVVGSRVSKDFFKAEIYKVTFSVEQKDCVCNYDLFLSSDELICEEERNALKAFLGIDILGEGGLFEVIDYKTDFTIQFDQENSSFINTKSVKEGKVFFEKKERFK